MTRALVSVLVLTLASALGAAQALPATAKLDAAMRAFWDAGEGETDKAAQQVLASGASVDEIRARLKAGRPYAKQKTGRIELPSKDHGLALDNIVEIPADYDPARPWPLRVSLHGGVGREAPGPGDPPARPLTNRIQSAGEIVLHPRAWAQSQWWNAGQVDNITRLVARVKRDYNVDESRIYITGISDGGTGVYFFAMRHGHAVVRVHAAQWPSAGDRQPRHRR